MGGARRTPWLAK